LVLTTKEYCREVTAIEPKWYARLASACTTSDAQSRLAEVAPNFFKVTDSAKMSKRKREEKITPLNDRFAQDQDAWRISKQKRASRTSGTFG
jgi:ATP-dependent RNA helicase DHX8/PRP22